MDSDGPFQLREGLSCDRLCERGAASFAQLPAACHTESKEGELFVTARTLLCALVLVTTNAFARPVQFTSTLRTNNDVAVNGSTADFQSGQAIGISVRDFVERSWARMNKHRAADVPETD